MIEPGVVAILGGDPVIGQALKLLVESSGHHARFVAEPIPDKPGELSGFGLLLLAPALSVEGRKALFDAVAATPEKTPVLELVPEIVGARNLGERFITWPCGARRLGRAIDAAGSRPAEWPTGSFGLRR